MSLINKMLEPPSYGWMDEKGNLIKPRVGQILKEFFHRLNIFRSVKNWLPLASWGSVLILIPIIVIFIKYHFNIWLAIGGFAYGMVVMGTHGTIWFHRYSTHRAYRFKNKFWRFVTQNLVPKMIPEEIYVISHHVHHAKSDQPGDPYNAQGGWLYCFLADVNHQLIAKDLNESEYEKVSNMLKHTGIKRNTYAQYKKWGSVSHPFYTVMQILLSYTFWYTVFFFIGGHALATVLLSGACLWAVGVRTFNYDGHGRGKDKRKAGTDFNVNDMSINQYWPGIVAGEWHSNHHLYPKSARAGFLKYQVDFAWYYIYALSKIGAISYYRDQKQQFIRQYKTPLLQKKVPVNEEYFELMEEEA